MKITLDNGTADYRITAYESGSIRINEETISVPVIVSPTKTELWDVGELQALMPNQLEYLLSYQPDVLILGTGPRQYFPPAIILSPLINAGIGLEIMDTAAACRTYNILMSEDRNVVAALFMI